VKLRNLNAANAGVSTRLWGLAATGVAIGLLSVAQALANIAGTENEVSATVVTDGPQIKEAMREFREILQGLDSKRSIKSCLIIKMPIGRLDAFGGLCDLDDKGALMLCYEGAIGNGAVGFTFSYDHEGLVRFTRANCVNFEEPWISEDPYPGNAY
jgi:hypothetical protein